LLTIPLYDRWELALPAATNFDRITLTTPSGEMIERPAFLHQPTELTYDVHGYEQATLVSEPVLVARVTPAEVGTWRYEAWGRGERLAEGAFVCTPSAHPGYVEVSPEDPRYFRFSEGQPYCPIGLNLCWPAKYPLSTGREFETSGRLATLGVGDFARWLRRLADNGGNFARLWLGMDYFQAEGEVAGELDLTRFAVLDAVVALARAHGVRLKLCLEYFRRLTPGSGQSRALRHPRTGEPLTSMDEWFTSDEWQALWWYKVEALLARYGDDPTVMAWELWNEINCCETSSWAIQRDWTRETLRKIKARSPRILVTNSLGSFDGDWAREAYRDFHMPEMDFPQVHRYLDQGAGWAICRTDPVALSIDAVQGEARRPERPILLAETGAVNDCHTGPFRYYRWDDDGLIFHDTTYPAFFAGAAGSGHIWHWDCYVDQKNLWDGFRALADAVEGVTLDREGVEALDLSTPNYWCLVLKGRSVVLGWVRNRADRWDHVLRDGQAPAPVAADIDLGALGRSLSRVELFRPWAGDATGEAVVEGTRLRLPAIRHGVVWRGR
jgi:hypothetical protein